MTTFDSGATRSLWMQFANGMNRAPLTGATRADACVVGAGIAGLSVAYELALAGYSVVVLDDGEIGGGQTLLTTGHLCNALDDRYYRIERMHGPEGARLAARSHSAAIDRIERIVTQESISCDFARVPGYLVVPPGEPDEKLARELDAARAAGLSVTLLDGLALAGHEFGRALRFDAQAKLDPAAYLAGLVRAIERAGARIYTHTHATSIEGGPRARVECENGAVVECSWIVVATNTPINDRLTMHTKQAPYRTYVIAGQFPREQSLECLLWDTADPYHYVRTQRMHDSTSSDWLIVGGEDHKTGQADDHAARFAALLAWTRARFPGFHGASFQWSGQVLEPNDALGFIGRNPLDEDNVYIVTGDSGNGLTHGMIAGLLIADLVGGRSNPWATLYDPGRVSLQAIGDFLEENLNFVAQYRDLVTPGEVRSAAEIGRDDGAVIRHGLKKVAVYRDIAGDLHAHSAICPHLGCAVRWNPTEKTWDCPCHGSRFDAIDGHVLNGPANRALAPEDEHEDEAATRPGQRSGDRARPESSRSR